MIFSGSKIYTIIAFIGAICLLGLSNCKPPDEPFDDIGEPVFTLKGTVDGKPMQLIAGVNGYYMHTDFAASTTDSIYRFSGKLAVDSCLNCEAIELIIGDDEIALTPSSVNINNALKDTIKFVDLNNAASKSYTIGFVAKDSGFSIPRYSWKTNVNPNDSAVIPNPSFTFNDTGAKTICLTIRDGNCSRTICNIVKPFDVDLGDSIPPAFEATVGKTVQFRNTSFGLSYFWEFGDGSTSVAYHPEHQYASPGTYNVCLTVKTIANTHRYCKLVDVNTPFFTCIANMVYQKPSVKTTPKSFASKAILRYTAENGDVYESNMGIQPPTSFLNILSNKNYLVNEKGQKTQQLNLSIKCRVFNTNGNDFKDLEITNGVIAIAHP